MANEELPCSPRPKWLQDLHTSVMAIAPAMNAFCSDEEEKQGAEPPVGKRAEDERRSFGRELRRVESTPFSPPTTAQSGSEDAVADEDLMALEDEDDFSERPASEPREPSANGTLATHTATSPVWLRSDDTPSGSGAVLPRATAATRFGWARPRCPHAKSREKCNG